MKKKKRYHGSRRKKHLKKTPDSSQSFEEKLKGPIFYIFLANPYITIVGGCIFILTTISNITTIADANLFLKPFLILLAIAVIKPALTEDLVTHIKLENQADVDKIKINMLMRTGLSIIWLSASIWPIVYMSGVSDSILLFLENIFQQSHNLVSEKVKYIVDFIVAGAGGWLGAIILGIIANIMTGKVQKK